MANKQIEEYFMHMGINLRVAASCAHMVAWWSSRLLSHAVHGVIPTRWTLHDTWGIAPHGMPAHVKAAVDAVGVAPTRLAAEQLVAVVKEIYNDDVDPHSGGMPASVRRMIDEARAKHPSAFDPAAPGSMAGLVAALEEIYAE